MASTREELVQKAQALLETLRYLSVEEVYVLDAQISNPATTEEELHKLCDAMQEFKKEQDSAYGEYKTEMINASKEYAKEVQAITEKQPAEAAPTSSETPQNVTE